VREWDPGKDFIFVFLTKNISDCMTSTMKLVLAHFSLNGAKWVLFVVSVSVINRKILAHQHHY